MSAIKKLLALTEGCWQTTHAAAREEYEKMWRTEIQLRHRIKESKDEIDCFRTNLNDSLVDLRIKDATIAALHGWVEKIKDVLISWDGSRYRCEYCLYTSTERAGIKHGPNCMYLYSPATDSGKAEKKTK